MGVALNLAILLLTACVVVLAILLLLPFLFAILTLLRQRFLLSPQSFPLSSLYVGRVWHTRLAPRKHAFTYPIFVFGIDLKEASDLDNWLWPLSSIARLRESDHLKNGEGGSSGHFLARVLRLVSQRTRQSLTVSSHDVLLLTHLCYYGYCFNPVSFYYLRDTSSGQLAAVVGEVSNTPWNEMHCYVLHKDSSDKVEVREDQRGRHYRFPKRFHVSPFMEMHYDYDWTFAGNDQQLTIDNCLRRRQADDGLQFQARMVVDRVGLHPVRIAQQLAVFPVFCAMIQVWIHYQALLLFLKGVAFQPHPTGAETLASRVIGGIMTPFFAWQAQWQSVKKE